MHSEAGYSIDRGDLDGTVADLATLSEELGSHFSSELGARMEKPLKPGGARITVVWGYDPHEIVLSPRNWSRIKRGGKLKIRSRGFYEGAPQWEYWTFAGGVDGDLLVEYGEGGGVGFDGKLSDATIEEAGKDSIANRPSPL